MSTVYQSHVPVYVCARAGTSQLMTHLSHDVLDLREDKTKMSTEMSMRPSALLLSPIAHLAWTEASKHRKSRRHSIQLMLPRIQRMMQSNGRKGRNITEETFLMRRRSTRRRSDTVFKAIVVVEIAFLVFLWTVVPDKIHSSILWQPSVSQSIRAHSRQEPSQRNKSRRWKQRQEAYSNRRAIPRSHHNPSHERLYKDPVPKSPTLIIGGSDGSGTRAMAETMKKLGVIMKTDSKNTLDVLAPPRSGGWPRLVNMVLNETHSVNYDIMDLSDDTRKELVFLLKRFWGEVQRFRRGRRTNEKRKSGVFVGFKAPAAMVMLPLLKKIIGPVKYLHVVRDGRDIAL